jgi:hypothetical protein
VESPSDPLSERGVMEGRSLTTHSFGFSFKRGEIRGDFIQRDEVPLDEVSRMILQQMDAFVEQLC